MILRRPLYHESNGYYVVKLRRWIDCSEDIPRKWPVQFQIIPFYMSWLLDFITRKDARFVKKFVSVFSNNFPRFIDTSVSYFTGWICISAPNRRLRIRFQRMPSWLEIFTYISITRWFSQLHSRYGVFSFTQFEWPLPNCIWNIMLSSNFSWGIHFS